LSKFRGPDSRRRRSVRQLIRHAAREPDVIIFSPWERAVENDRRFSIGRSTVTAVRADCARRRQIKSRRPHLNTQTQARVCTRINISREIGGGRNEYTGFCCVLTGAVALTHAPRTIIVARSRSRTYAPHTRKQYVDYPPCTHPAPLPDTRWENAKKTDRVKYSSRRPSHERAQTQRIVVNVSDDNEILTRQAETLRTSVIATRGFAFFFFCFLCFWF